MESRTVDIDGPVHYVEWTGPEDGPTFVCVHGLGGSHLNWVTVAPALAKRGRVLALDLAGFGRTPLAGRTAAVPDNRRLVDRFIRTVAGEPVVLMGNSMGGYISIMQASRAPQTVSGLVLVNAAVPRQIKHSIDKLVAGAFAAYMIPGVGEKVIAKRVEKLGVEGVVREALKLCTVEPSRVDPDVCRAMVELGNERLEMPWATTAFLQAARSLVRLLARRKDFARMVAEISAPTLVISGRRDRLVPSVATEAIAATRPDWDLVVMDDIGHIPQLEAPQETLAAIETWLDGPHARLFAGGSARGSLA